MSINTSKLVYVNPTVNYELRDKVYSKLIEIGFNKNQIVFADATKHGEIGHYTAHIWKYEKKTSLMINEYWHYMVLEFMYCCVFRYA
jgi:hypothetical protein